MPSTTLLKRDWEKDHVYLVQFPRAGVIPSLSPFSLKLETWLRINDIPYSNVSNEFTKKSSKGQVPFIELNGRQFPDSNLIIEHLTQEFHKEELDGKLVPVDRAVARAFYALIEHHLLWVNMYSRGQDNAWWATDKGFGHHLSGVKAIIFKNVIIGRMKKMIQSRAVQQGIGRLSQDEIISSAKKDLEAISVQLGNKKYLMGDRVSTIDATAFGHLAQLIYPPQHLAEIKPYMESTTPNILAYIERIKDQYWPDWDEAIKTFSLDTKWKKN